jgi:hypothetical protein
VDCSHNWTTVRGVLPRACLLVALEDHPQRSTLHQRGSILTRACQLHNLLVLRSCRGRTTRCGRRVRDLVDDNIGSSSDHAKPQTASRMRAASVGDPRLTTSLVQTIIKGSYYPNGIYARGSTPRQRLQSYPLQRNTLKTAISSMHILESCHSMVDRAKGIRPRGRHKLFYRCPDLLQ